jgi:hypothetical protein
VVISIDVDNWERAARAVVEAEGTVLTEKTAIPGVGYFAYCRDTEGNVFGILESDSHAVAVDASEALTQTNP